MHKPQLSWQGIGISSNPNQRREPLSLHLLAYLAEASAFSHEHVLVVADTPQASNYMALHGLDEKTAKKVARKKGRKRESDLKKILRANKINNVHVVRWDHAMQPHQDIAAQVNELYHDNQEIRTAVLGIVPERLREKAGNDDLIAQYALDEIAAILSLEGIKIGHERERGYDHLAQRINEEFAIGQKPEFHYSKHGLEYIPGTGRRVEPYSSFIAPGRLLLTDSKRKFRGKMQGLKPKTFKKTLEFLRANWDANPEDTGMFYDRTVKPTFNRFAMPRRAAALAAVVMLTAGYMPVHIHHDATQMRQLAINEIPGFVFSGDSQRASDVMRETIREVNEQIQTKYGITNYFDA